MVPLVVLLDLVVLAITVPGLLVALVVSAIARSSRSVRSVLLVAAYAVTELSLLPRVVFRRVTDWQAFLGEVLDRTYRILRSVLDVRVELEAGSATPAQVATGNPLIVLARHCGPGDSLFVAWLLTGHYGLRLGVVLTSELRAEPLVDIAGDHLPLCFVSRRKSGTRQRVGELAGALTAGDALLLFPEGGNFSWARWRRAVDSLVTTGRYRAARLARGHTHTLPPHHGGAGAALAGAPAADVLLLTHSGFTSDGRDRPWWRVPVHRTLLVRTAVVPAAEVPREDAALTTWLETTWSTVDNWVAGHST